MNGKSICPKDKCTGCMACVNICPMQCISMKARGGGHLHPSVDMKMCISCNKCEQVCTVNHPRPLSYPLTAYAGWHKDVNEYHTSTSGGAATALSQKVIAEGGVVYGCASLPLFEIKHIRVDNHNDLAKLKGSKYVQSAIGDSYIQVRKDIRQGLKVLFIGTPCQVSGLKNFLGKEYDNLYTIDLICHGVPSQLFLKQHIQKITNGNGVQVAFRKGNDMGLRIFDSSNAQIYYSNVWYNRYQDVFFNTFIDGYTYRSSCYQCPFAQTERCSDITIGDFWGIGDDLQHDRVNGCSSMLPITEKGMVLLQGCKLHFYERTVEEAVKGNAQLRHPVKLDGRRRVFRHLAPIMGVGLAYWFCEIDHIFEKKIIARIKRYI